VTASSKSTTRHTHPPFDSRFAHLAATQRIYSIDGDQRRGVADSKQEDALEEKKRNFFPEGGRSYPVC
jgi:hypothetical protein